MASKNEKTLSKESNSRRVLYKNPFDTYFDMTLFSYRCSEFVFRILYRNYFNPNGRLSDCIDLVDPHVLQDYLDKFAQNGVVAPLFTLRNVDFRLTHGIDVYQYDSYVGDILVVSAPLRFYLHQLVKAYALFYKNFNFRNYIIK